MVTLISCRQRWRKPSRESRATKGSLEPWWSTQKVTLAIGWLGSTQRFTGDPFIMLRAKTLTLDSELKKHILSVPALAVSHQTTIEYLLYTNHSSKTHCLQCLCIPKKYYTVSSSETLAIHIISGGPAKLSCWKEGKLLLAVWFGLNVIKATVQSINLHLKLKFSAIILG